MDGPFIFGINNQSLTIYVYDIDQEKEFSKDLKLFLIDY